MIPRALIFDFDGTLADTMPVHYRVWQDLARRHGFYLPEDRFYAFGGVPTRDIVNTLAREQGLHLDCATIVREKKVGYLARLHEVKVIPALVRIAWAHYGRLPLAVASGGARRVVEQVLAYLHLRPLFAAVVTHEDVARQKPAPDIFLEAARRLGVPPCRCRAYEDTDLGLAAIRAAGMEAVDVRVLLRSRASAGAAAASGSRKGNPFAGHGSDRLPRRCATARPAPARRIPCGQSDAGFPMGRGLPLDAGTRACGWSR